MSNYISVKNFIGLFREPFDQSTNAIKKAKENLKERGINITTKAGKEEIEPEVLAVIAEWERLTNAGEEAHKVIQTREMSRFPGSVFEGYTPTKDIEDQVDIQIDNHLKRGVHYFEKKIVDNSLMMLGYIDHVFVDSNGYIHIEDYKSTKNFTRGFTFEKNGMRFQKKFYYPIDHVVDCKYSFAALQCSVYMYLIWKYNPKLKPGTIRVTHIHMDDEGNMKNIETIHDGPFLIEEVKAMIREYKKNNNGI